MPCPADPSERIGSRDDVRTIVIARDVGMEASVLLSAQLRKRLGGRIDVVHRPVDALPVEADLVITQTHLAARVRQLVPHLPVVAFSRPVGDPGIDALVARLTG